MRGELRDNPSLKPKLTEIGEDAYETAVGEAAFETGKEEKDFPATFGETGWIWGEVLNIDFYPD